MATMASLRSTPHVRQFVYDSPTAAEMYSITEKLRLRAAGFIGERLLRAGWALAVLVVGRYHHLRIPQALQNQLELLKPVPPQREALHFGLKEFALPPLLVA